MQIYGTIRSSEALLRLRPWVEQSQLFTIMKLRNYGGLNVHRYFFILYSVQNMATRSFNFGHEAQNYEFGALKIHLYT